MIVSFVHKTSGDKRHFDLAKSDDIPSFEDFFLVNALSTWFYVSHHNLGIQYKNITIPMLVDFLNTLEEAKKEHMKKFLEAKITYAQLLDILDGNNETIEKVKQSFVEGQQ